MQNLKKMGGGSVCVFLIDFSLHPPETDLDHEQWGKRGPSSSAFNMGAENEMLTGAS